MKENAGKGRSREAGRQTDPEGLHSLTSSPSMLLGSPLGFMVAPGSAVDRGDANLRVIEDKTAQYPVLTDISVP